MFPRHENTFAGRTQGLHVLLQMIAGSVARYSRIAFAWLLTRAELPCVTATVTLLVLCGPCPGCLQGISACLARYPGFQSSFIDG